VKQCPVLEALKRIVVLMDDEIHGRVLRHEYCESVDVVKRHIDKLVIENCNTKEEQNGHCGNS